MTKERLKQATCTNPQIFAIKAENKKQKNIKQCKTIYIYKYIYIYIYIYEYTYNHNL